MLLCNIFHYLSLQFSIPVKSLMKSKIHRENDLIDSI